MKTKTILITAAIVGGILLFNKATKGGLIQTAARTTTESIIQAPIDLIKGVASANVYHFPNYGTINMLPLNVGDVFTLPLYNVKNSWNMLQQAKAAGDPDKWFL